jgi:hypothetical protein
MSTAKAATNKKWEFSGMAQTAVRNRLSQSCTTYSQGASLALNSLLRGALI